jgi:hypothetical protein
MSGTFATKTINVFFFSLGASAAAYYGDQVRLRQLALH